MIDLHSFLEAYKGEHIHVKKPVKLEHVGALTAQASDTIVFDNLEGFPGWRLVDQLFVNRKAQARVLGCEPANVVRRLAEIMRIGPKLLAVVDNPPCQQRVFLGKDVDLSMLPVVRHTDIDPYPYTTGFVVHRDPDSDRYNLMFPRCGVLGRNEMVTSYVSTTAIRWMARYRQLNKKMPQALAIGTHPAWELAGCYSHLHDDWWEAELFQTITGQVGQMARCKTVDLIVPADASIVVEGFVHPTRTAQDGPSPGPTMLYCPYAAQQPVFEVTAITMREDPIYRNHQMTPFTDHQEMPRLFHEAIIYERLRAMGLKVHDVHFPSGGGSLSVILQVEPAADGQVKDALLATLGCPWMNMKMAVAVDPDVNIYDHRDVHYAVATRVDPARDVITIDGARGFPFDPSAHPVIGAMSDTDATRYPCTVGKWGIDATKPVPYRSADRKYFERAWPANWGKVKLEDYLD